ncbi:MAG TPA: monovalent cation:proton antiporter-2 (CPA2) family protein [Gammaproteobacteria bacterium]|nr:monovalent cation:proton antiporter-2 (CPA2) family protein [Gammaproteobacteria bacterium]
MDNLTYVAIYLSAAVLSVALMKRFGFAAVLGYLFAGIAIGPWGLGLIEDVTSAQHLAEFGVVLLLFVIGLELQPSRLWALRRPIFGLGSAQVLGSGAVLGAAAIAVGLGWQAATIVGLGLAMSSTAFVLQLLAEKRELATIHGRASFAILLFQDIAVIPLLAIVPLLAAPDALAEISPLVGGAKFLAVCVGLSLASRFVLRPLFHLVARSEVPELFTATALLVVVATSLLMHAFGLSATLGAFLAGVLLADSEYRHELEARIAPFEGLLLGLFFISVGMSANLGLAAASPGTVLALVAGLMGAKFALMYGIARVSGMARAPAARLGAVLSQGGEFAFILFALAREQGLLATAASDLLMLVVTVSMGLTPVVYALAMRVTRRPPARVRDYERIIDTDHQVVIAGFGRVGQIMGRILRALQIPFTALEINPDQVETVQRFGSKAYYGDASNLELLHAARIDKAKVFVLAIDDVEASLRTAEVVKRHFPEVTLYARARNRRHMYRLMDLGLPYIERETYHSALLMTEQVLVALGLTAGQARRAVLAFRHHDEKTLQETHAIYKDDTRLVQSTREAADELRALFESDARLQPRAED